MRNPSDPTLPKKPGAPTGNIGASPLPLLLLPGTLCDGRVFAPMLAAMAARKHVPARAVHLADLTDETVMERLARRVLAGAPDRFIAVGFSLGGILALNLAVLAPQRVAGMALIAANARDVPPERHAARRAATRQSVAKLVGETLWPDYVAPTRLDDAGLRATVVAMAEASPSGAAQRQTEIALSRADLRPLLASLAMPALVIGGALDAVAPPQLQRELADGLPAAGCVMVPGAGHFAPLEDPEACGLALAAWLARVDPEQPATPHLAPSSSPEDIE